MALRPGRPRLSQSGERRLHSQWAAPQLPAPGFLASFHAAKRDAPMRRINGHYECSVCDEVLDVGDDIHPTVMMLTATGERAQRLLLVGGSEVHRCAVGQPSSVGHAKTEQAQLHSTRSSREAARKS